MFGFKPRLSLKIEVFDDYFLINGSRFEAPFHENDIIAILGEADYKERDPVWHLAWHNLGVSLTYAAWDKVSWLDLQIETRLNVKHRPKKCFRGDVYVNGELLDLAQKQSIKLLKYQAVFRKRPDEKVPSTLEIGKNFDYKAPYDPKKYVHKKPRGKVISFEDFNFKLAVIQELMYHQDILEPKFDLYDFVDWYKDRDIDIEDEGYDFIPEVTQWFRTLPITEEHAQHVTQLHQDGGEKIYGQLLRFWDGECDMFDIRSAEDAKPFKALNSVKLFGLTATLKAEFEALNIQVL